MALPEKDFYTLDEIASRWSHAGCDKLTFLDYARRDLLVFSVYLRKLESHKAIKELPDGQLTTIRTTELSFQSADYVWHSIRYLKANDARRILEAKDNEQVAVNVLYSSRERTKEGGTGYLQSHYFTHQELIITRAERDRFESEHKANRAAGRLRHLWRWMGKEENQAPLKLLGAMVAGSAAAVWAVVTWILN
jgi:hypothetical protein